MPVQLHVQNPNSAGYIYNLGWGDMVYCFFSSVSYHLEGPGRRYSNGNICLMKPLTTSEWFSPEKYTAGHTFYSCTSEGSAYIIDLEDRKVVQVLANQR